ncbi:MAG TPA: DUF433 domain-containing protein [Bryobacteraceae bacterium]|nr:DUF433 domain-containing protein [Bryobacteraceae bacterium]
MPTYDVKEAAGYLRVPPSTLRWWFFGQPARREQRGYAPIFLGADPESGLISFFNLVEAHVLSSLKIEYTSMRTNSVRRALDHVRQNSPEKLHPLVTERFLTDGKDLFMDILAEDKTIPSGETVNVSLGGQRPLDIMNEYLQLVDYEAGFALKLFPKAGDRVIVLNPKISAGRPIVVGTGYLASIIRQRALAGETPEELARDYDLTQIEIEKAIKFTQAA